MRCSEVRRRVTDSVLGDLDSEFEQGLREHLKECSECRRAEAAMAKTVRLLRSPEGAPSSTERRELTVSAMIRAHGDRMPGPTGSPRRSWMGSLAAAAAFFLVATAAVVLLHAPGATAFRVTAVTGQADHRNRQSGLWEPLVPGMTIRLGDRVVTQGECQVRFEVGPGTLTLDQNSSVEWVSGSRIALDRGRLLVDLHGALAEPLTICDTANNSASLREGRMEVSLRPLPAAVAGAQQIRGQRAVIPEGRLIVLWRLKVRLEAGEAFLAGTRDQRLRADSGQEGSFDSSGKPETSLSAPGSVTTWPDLGSGEKR